MSEVNQLMEITDEPLNVLPIYIVVIMMKKL